MMTAPTEDGNKQELFNGLLSYHLHQLFSASLFDDSKVQSLLLQGVTERQYLIKFDCFIDFYFNRNLLHIFYQARTMLIFSAFSL